MKNFFKTLVFVTAGWAVIVVALSIIGSVPVNEQQPDTFYFSGLESFLLIFIITIPYVLGAAAGSYLLYLLLRKVKLNKIIAGISSTVLVVGALIGVSIVFDRANVTNQLFLVPDGYTGNIYIVYNVEGAPSLEKENGYTVIPINEKGYYLTSTPDMNYGTVTDRYYYVNKTGDRTAINGDCVSSFGNAGYQTSENEEVDLTYTGFKLINNKCSEMFKLQNHNSELHGNPAVGAALSEYYDLVNHY